MAKTTQQQSPKDFFYLSNQEATQNQGELTAQTHNENYGNLTQSQNRGEAKLAAWTEENSANECGNQQPTNIHEPTTHTIPNVMAGELT